MLIVGSLSLGCEGSQLLDGSTDSVPDLVRESFVPSASYAMWWSELESCSGVTGDFDRLRFFEVVAPVFVDGQQFPCGQGFVCNGMWESPHDISVAPAFRRTERLVKHEMLHDLLLVVDHPPVFDACEASWDFGDPRGRRRP